MTDLIKITDLDTLESPADGDWVPVVDISDTTSGAGGTTKKVTKAKLKGLNWQGAWSAGTYVLDDAVENDGSAWVCIAASTTEEPSAIATDWDLLASKGDTGATGSQGSQGIQGDDGDFINTYQGAWSAGTYTIGQIVTNAGSSWICTAASTTEEPTGTPVDWDKIADRGAQGPAGSGTGDMLEAIYDPTAVAGDAFDMDNMVEGADTKIMTAAERAAIITNSAKVSYTDAAKVAGIENGADVTDAVNVGAVNAAAASKGTPVDADSFPIVDSEASNVIKRLTFTNLKTFLKTWIDSLTTTFTNKRITKRTSTTTSSATPTINTDNVDYYSLTAQTADITSFTTNLSGTPTLGQQLRIDITGTAARAITWGASFANGPVALPTTTVTTTRLSVLFEWDGSIWRCMASGSTV